MSTNPTINPSTKPTPRSGVGIRLRSVGTALPDGLLTNADFEAMMETTDEWIVSRTGIKERRVGGTTTGLATEAARVALDRSGVDADQVDLVIVATQTPDDLCPSTAAGVQHGLGLTCGAFDLNAACAGFSYALVTAHSMLKSAATSRHHSADPRPRAAIVVGVDRMTAATNYDDRGTAILFGDGAGAVVLVAEPNAPDGLLSWDLGTDGGHRDILTSPIKDGRITGVEMDGKAVFKLMVGYAVDSARRALRAAGVELEDLAAVLAHQANQRILDAVANRLGADPALFVSVIAGTGNTSAASVPLALDAAVSDGTVSPGDTILLAGFGGGLSWATTVATWGRHRVLTPA